MPNRVEDIVPGDRRSIRDVRVDRKTSAGTSRHAPEKPSEKSAEKDREIPIHRIRLTPPSSHKPVYRQPNRKKPWVFIVIIAVLLLCGGAVVLSTYEARATFTIVPNVIDVAVGQTYLATDTASASSSISYQLMPFSASASSTVPAVTGPYTTTKAQGTVTLYNAYSSQPQRLVAGTRLADDSGLIYRLTSSVTIPGLTGSGSSVVPGNMTATIVADQPGPSYNISSEGPVSDFKIVAYQGTPRYDTMYARLSSDVEGGSSGYQKTVSPGALASTTAILQAQLTASLLAQAKNSIPASSIMYDGMYVTSVSSPIIAGVGSSTAVVSVQETLTSISFDRNDLSALLVGSQAGAFGSFPYDTQGLDALSVSISDSAIFSPQKKNTLLFHVQGPLKLVAVIPTQELTEKFMGVSLAQTRTILGNYGQIIDLDQSSAALTPSWVTKVPDNASRITIVVKNM